MKNQALRWAARGFAVLAAASLGGLTVAQAGDRERPPPSPVHYNGLINDYTPSAAVVKNGPYQMSGKWSLDVDVRRGTAKFSAVMNMETSDFGIIQGNLSPDDPKSRGAHTHHIVMTDGVVNSSSDWMTICPAFSPVITDGFVITGTAFITGNGGPAPFGASPITLCILGGENVKFSNITFAFGAKANTHFGSQAIHGVITRCAGPWEFESKDCTVQE
jgi:hypothetical protein